jgi:hypothetical protein
MSLFIGSNTAVENTRTLAQSALPDAPVVPDVPRRVRRSFEVRARAGAVLRAAARRELRLADRIDPAWPQPS